MHTLNDKGTPPCRHTTDAAAVTAAGSSPSSARSGRYGRSDRATHLALIEQHRTPQRNPVAPKAEAKWPAWIVVACGLIVAAIGIAECVVLAGWRP